MKLFLLLSLSILCSLFATSISFAQASLADDRLFGAWVQTGTGNRLEFRNNREVGLFFTGPNIAGVSGLGSYETLVCSTAGANLCIEAPQFKCSFRYDFAGGELNLQFRSGNELCRTAVGDYRRRDAQR